MDVHNSTWVRGSVSCGRMCTDRGSAGQSLTYIHLHLFILEPNHRTPMEPAGLKGGWRSFTTSVFGSGGGGVGSGGRGGGGECLSLHLDHLDSLVSVGEDEGPGEDVSLLENRPVDQKKLRKR